MMPQNEIRYVEGVFGSVRVEITIREELFHGAMKISTAH
jgi:hypothetical protein